MQTSYKNKIIIFILIIISILFYVYLHPTKESMYCDENLVCSTNKQYLGFIEIKSRFALNQNSRIFFKDHIRSATKHHIHNGGRIYTHVVHLEISNEKGKFVRPFTTYYMGYSGGWEDKSLQFTTYERIRFDSYIKNPPNGFYLEVNPQGNLLLIVTVLGTLFCFAMYYVFNFIENLFKSLFNAIFKRK